MDRSLSTDANSCSAIQQKLTFSQQPATATVLMEFYRIRSFLSYSLTSILMLSSYLRLGPLLDFRTENLYAFLLSPTSTTCPAHFILLDVVNDKCFVRQTGHETPHLTSFYTFLLLPPL